MRRIGTVCVVAGLLLLLWPHDVAGQGEAPALKVFVEADGMYQLTPADLFEAGFPPEGLDPRYLRLTTGEVEVAMVVAGEGDGVFDDGDHILFYGQAATGPYTRRNVYWLTLGAASGARMAHLDGTPSGAHPTPHAFPDTLHAEEDHVYWQNPPDGASADHWFWSEGMQAPGSTLHRFGLDQVVPERPATPRIVPKHGTDDARTTWPDEAWWDSSAPFTYTAPSWPTLRASASVSVNFSVDQVVPDGQATLRVGLRGRTDDPISPDHHTRVALNAAWLDEAWWDGAVPFTHTALFSSTLLASGVNTLTVETVGDTGASVDTVYLNWLEVDYQHGYTATHDLLRFTAPASGTWTFELAGFSGEDVWLFDVTTPLTPTRMVSATVSEGAVRFSAHATPATRYLALTPAAWQTPIGLELDRPSALRSSANGADEIVIAPLGFHTALEPLVAHRWADGLRVALVDVQDIYDEFSWGRFHPPAIGDFLRYAYHHWQHPAPRFVLLVGDANMDYLDRFRNGVPNYVPTQLIDTWQVGETPSDNGFVCLEGEDVLPEMALGRIPARTAEEVTRVVDKIMAYEGAPAAGHWNRRALFVADDDSPTFEAVSEGLIGELPPAYQPLRLYARGYTGDLRADLADAINSGVLLVNYVGHGSVDNWGTWAGGRIWVESDVGQLHNEALPLVTAATCINGFFAHPLDARSLAEAWLLEEHGAVAAWAPTALGDPSGHFVLFSGLYEALFTPSTSLGQGEDLTRIGEATRLAKWAAYEQSPVHSTLIETYVLFGDPATRLRILERPYAIHLPCVVRGSN